MTKKSENYSIHKAMQYDALLTAVPDGEIMNAIHKQKPIKPQNGFENAMMKREYVAGFLTAVKWMQERHCS